MTPRSHLTPPFSPPRLDATRPGFGELGLLGLITEALGPAAWRNTMAVLTHAHAARTAFGAQYDINSRQRRNIVSQLLRQAAGDQQTRSPVFLADCHPSCPTNSLGQPVILEGPTAVPWKQQLLVQVRSKLCGSCVLCVVVGEVGHACHPTPDAWHGFLAFYTYPTSASLPAESHHLYCLVGMTSVRT